MSGLRLAVVILLALLLQLALVDRMSIAGVKPDITVLLLVLLSMRRGPVTGTLLGFFLARGRSLAQLALLIAAMAAAVQLWKTHAGGTYVMWYLPFLLLGLFGRAAGGPKTSAPDVVTVAADSADSVEDVEIVESAED